MPTTLDDPGLDFAGWSEEKLTRLVDRIAAVPAGSIAIRRKLASLPPEADGRVVTEEPIREGLVLRLQYVPCGKPKCRKQPDEHGPYWYSYYFVKGRWKREYHGRNRPPAEDFWTTEQAKSVIAALPQGQRLDDQQVTMLETLANAMASMSEDLRAAALEQRARQLVSAERQRRDDEIRQRYEELASRKTAGVQLTSGEREELNRICDVLAQDH